MKFWRVFDIDGQQQSLDKLLAESNKDNFWDDPGQAKHVMQEINKIESLQTKIGYVQSIGDDINSAFSLIDNEKENTDELLQELMVLIVDYEKNVSEMQLEIAFKDEYDFNDALISIHAGAGGTEAQDWAEMLLRMYLRWSKNNNFVTKIISINASDEAGIKSVQFSVEGDKAYGFLKAEKGVHRLVRISPFDASKSRHTSFALVEASPKVDDGNDEITINQEDIRIDTYRASGHGGQSVQKNDTAVRITHLTSGIVVTCQNERSQARNKETAMMVLKSKLIKLQLEEKEKLLLEERGEHIVAGWGNQIRSYVLHPYKMVKDLRTDIETSNVNAVLDGAIDEFIKSYLLMK
ncbi:MAG: peptide chain release factor 2 [Dehalococcoidaceae bacterium]|nr:peptide chain release factor 2 [Dehalococcoidaceae bacterium]